MQSHIQSFTLFGKTVYESQLHNAISDMEYENQNYNISNERKSDNSVLIAYSKALLNVSQDAHEAIFRKANQNLTPQMQTHLVDYFDKELYNRICSHELKITKNNKIKEEKNNSHDNTSQLGRFIKQTNFVFNASKNKF